MRIQLVVRDVPDCAVRSFTLEDAASIARHANDARIARGLRDGFPHPYGIDDARAYLGAVIGKEPETSYAIAVGGEVVGGIGVTLGDDVERYSAEIGYWLGVEHWGRGIATAALAAMTEHAMRAFGLIRVFALPMVSNPASARVLEKAGFVREGRLRASAVKAGAVEDQWMYAFVRAPASGRIDAAPKRNA